MNTNSTIQNLKYELVVIGASLGGFRALNIVFKELPDDFPLPVAVVVHRHEESDYTLIELLQKNCRLRIKEAEDKEPVKSSVIYIAPAGYHLLIEKGHFALSIDSPVSQARPSVDVLFDSAADIYGSRVIGIILTGTGEDGAGGLNEIKKHGGTIIIQDPETAEGAAMPEAAIHATGCEKIIPLMEIGGELIKLTGVKR